MNRLIVVNCLFLVVILISVKGLKGQQPTIIDDWSINIPSSPLKIKLNQGEGGDITITNSSKYNVMSFKVGCVAKKGDNYYKIADGRKLDIKLDNSGGAFLVMDISRFEKIEKQTCLSKDSKMGIIEVIFDDGSFWGLMSFKRKK